MANKSVAPRRHGREVLFGQDSSSSSAAAAATAAALLISCIHNFVHIIYMLSRRRQKGSWAADRSNRNVVAMPSNPFLAHLQLCRAGQRRAFLARTLTTAKTREKNKKKATSSRGAGGGRVQGQEVPACCK